MLWGPAFGNFGAFKLQVRHVIEESGGLTTHNSVQTGAKKMLREYRNRLAYWSGVRLVSVAAAGAETRGRQGWRLRPGITGSPRLGT